MIKSLSSIFQKDRPWSKCSRWPLKRSNRSQKTKTYVSYVSDSFPTFSAKRSNCSLRSYVTISIFLKDRRDRFALVDLWKRLTVIELILSNFKKERPLANQSRQCFVKIDRNNSIFFTIESIFWSFYHKKWAIRSKNRWSNSQPCSYPHKETFINGKLLKGTASREKLLNWCLREMD